MEGVSTKVEVFSGVEIRSKITEWVRIHSCFLKSGYSDGHRNMLTVRSNVSFQSVSGAYFENFISPGWSENLFFLKKYQKYFDFDHS